MNKGKSRGDFNSNHFFKECLNSDTVGLLESKITANVCSWFNCKQVSLGLLRKNTFEIMALSHASELNKQAKLNTLRASVMDEAMNGKADMRFPSSLGVDSFNYFHAKYHKYYGKAAMATILLRDINKKVFAALLLEREQAQLFSQEEMNHLEDLAEYLGPLLYLKHRERRSLLACASEQFHVLIKKTVLADDYKHKVGTVAFLFLLVFVIFSTSTYRVVATATLEGSVQRHITSPIEGFVTKSNVRAGDIVKEKDILCELDDQELQLEREKLHSELKQLKRNYRKEFSENNRSEVTIVQAKIQQVRAKLDLIKSTIDRLKVKAPMGGIIIEGDLESTIGSPIEKGQVLFKISPLDYYRIILQVDESDISEIKLNQVGLLALASIPDEKLAVKVKHITPVSVANEGQNIFRVEAELLSSEAIEKLRPGMEGVAKIEIEKRNTVWIWSHKFLEWLNLKFWHFKPY